MTVLVGVVCFAAGLVAGLWFGAVSHAARDADDAGERIARWRAQEGTRRFYVHSTPWLMPIAGTTNRLVGPFSEN